MQIKGVLYLMDSGKMKKSIGRRLVFFIVSTVLIMQIVTTVVGYEIYRGALERRYIDLGQSITRSAAEIVNGDKTDGYLSTLRADAEYEEISRILNIIRAESGIKYLYVQKPAEEGVFFIFDTGDDPFPLGHMDSWNADFPEFKNQMVNYGPVEPVISNTEYGWVLSVYEPVYGSDGGVKAYVGADFPMERFAREHMEYLLIIGGVSLLIAVLGVIFGLYMIRRSILTPIGILTRAANDYLIKQDSASEEISSLAAMEIHTRDELEQLCNAMKHMEHNIRQYIKRLQIVTIKAETDPLTGLWNRDSFRQGVELYLSGEQAAQRVGAFMIVDVDYFKQVNDRYGHIAGDEVLIECARAMRKVLRDSDFIARQGGDEFIIFCKDIGDEQIAVKNAQRIRNAWRGIVPKGGDAPVTASIGIALTPRDGGTYQELYANSDMALYRAKERGRDGFVLFGESDAPPE
jgi:diguanylate cyclase (GGDEF)-like protein